MYIWSDCIPCILKMAIGVARNVLKTEEENKHFMSRILELKSLRGEDWKMISPMIVSDIWLILKEMSGKEDPLKTVKEEQNLRAMKIYPSAKKTVQKSEDPFLQALKFSIAGNAMDAMVNSNETGQRGLSMMLAQMLINMEDVLMFRERLAKSDKVVYFTDNCGEVVFDRLFVETLNNEYHPQITFVTRRMPVLNDVTVELAEAVGLGKLGRVIDNGIVEPFPGTLLKKVSPEVRQLVEDANLLIAKGVGNYDSLTEEAELKGKVSFLFHGKCHPCCIERNVSENALIVYNA